MNKLFILPIAFSLAAASAFSQKAVAPKAGLTRADQTFVQDAINSNNEAITLAQMAIRKSQSTQVNQIARQVLTDHVAAQKKLYAIAHLKDSVSFSRSVMPSSSTTKLPLSDNLNSRRNSTVVSISNSGKNTAQPQPATSTSSAGNTIVGVAANQQPTRNGITDTSSSFSRNQTFNGNTSIDNANGINNPVRTEIGSASGRWTENTTVINNQPVSVAAQPVTSGITAPVTSNDVTNNSAVINGTPVNNINNTPSFPSRSQDTVRMSGQSQGFENPGTNLSFPGNARYANTTPNAPANGNAGSDYGVQSGVVVNNTQTNALNTAPYSSNEINSNIVQTGQQQGTYNPTSVINSSTTSINNNQVAFNNANANRANDIAIRTRPAGTVVTNPSGKNVAATNSTGREALVVADTTTTIATAAPTLVGRARNRRAGGSNTSGGTPNTVGNATPATNAFYTSPTTITSSITTLQNTQPDAFDKEWINQLLLNQQTATQHYQAAVKATHQVQVKTYINTTLPLIQGHQFALKQWQMK